MRPLAAAPALYLLDSRLRGLYSSGFLFKRTQKAPQCAYEQGQACAGLLLSLRISEKAGCHCQARM